MLVLKRRIGEQVVIDGHIRVKLLAVNNGAARIGFEAADDVVILREEIMETSAAEPSEDGTALLARPAAVR